LSYARLIEPKAEHGCIFVARMYLFILAQAAGGNGQIMQFVLMAAIFVVFYMFMIRPQQQKAKEQKKFIDNLKAGDKVVTTGGMHGKIVTLSDLIVVLEIDRGLKATFDRAAISMEASKKAQTEDSK